MGYSQTLSKGNLDLIVLGTAGIFILHTFLHIIVSLL